MLRRKKLRSSFFDSGILLKGSCLLKGTQITIQSKLIDSGGPNKFIVSLKSRFSASGDDFFLPWLFLMCFYLYVIFHS